MDTGPLTVTGMIEGKEKLFSSISPITNSILLFSFNTYTNNNYHQNSNNNMNNNKNNKNKNNISNVSGINIPIIIQKGKKDSG